MVVNTLIYRMLHFAMIWVYGFEMYPYLRSTCLVVWMDIFFILVTESGKRDNQTKIMDDIYDKRIQAQRP